MKITRWSPTDAGSTAGGGAASGPAGGDLGGGYPSPQVTGLDGKPFAASGTETNGVVPTYNSSTGQWDWDVPGGSGTPATSVTGPDAFGAAAVVGVSTNYARQDHDHGLPAAPGQFVCGFDANGFALFAGKMQDVIVPHDGTITGWTLLADVVGQATVDIWKTTYAAYSAGSHPVVGDAITGSAKPSMSGAEKATSTTLTGWTTSVSAGDILRFHLDLAATITRLVLVVAYDRT